MLSWPQGTEKLTRVGTVGRSEYGPADPLDAVRTRFRRLLKWHGCGIEPAVDKGS